MAGTLAAKSIQDSIQELADTAEVRFFKRFRPRLGQGFTLKPGHVALGVVLFLSACALEPQTLKRTPLALQDNGARAERADQPVRSTRRPSRENVLAEDQGLEETEELGDEVSDEAQFGGDGGDGNQDGEIASLEIDLTNFKDRLVGLDADELSELLGTPDFERDEPPAKIWQYRTPICVVDLFLFEEEGSLKVDLVELRGREEETIDDIVCFASVLESTEQDAPADVPEEGVPGAIAPTGTGAKTSSFEEQIKREFLEQQRNDPDAIIGPAGIPEARDSEEDLEGPDGDFDEGGPEKIPEDGEPDGLEPPSTEFIEEDPEEPETEEPEPDDPQEES